MVIKVYPPLFFFTIPARVPLCVLATGCCHAINRHRVRQYAFAVSICPPRLSLPVRFFRSPRVGRVCFSNSNIFILPPVAVWPPLSDPHSAGIYWFCPPCGFGKSFCEPHSLLIHCTDNVCGKKLSKAIENQIHLRAWIREKDTTIHGVNRAEAQSYSKFEGNQRQSLAVCLFFASFCNCNTYSIQQT